jgi:DNA-binding response OmpR family regulator
MNILVCEDDVLIRKVIKAQLEKDGYTVKAVSDGKQGLFAMEHSSFDLIMLDLLMPYVNGFEFISLIKQSPFRDIPIVVLSKLGDKKTIDLTYSLGADYYMLKPFDPNEIGIIVNAVLKRNDRKAV